MKFENNWIPKTTAKAIEEAGVIPFCKELLLILRDCWKGSDEIEFSQLGGGATAAPTIQVLRPAPTPQPPDFTPLMIKPYMKTHSNDFFEELPVLLSEMLLRI